MKVHEHIGIVYGGLNCVLPTSRCKIYDFNFELVFQYFIQMTATTYVAQRKIVHHKHKSER